MGHRYTFGKMARWLQRSRENSPEQSLTTRKMSVDKRTLRRVFGGLSNWPRGEDYSVWLSRGKMRPNSDVDLLAIQRDKAHRGRLLLHC